MQRTTKTLIGAVAVLAIALTVAVTVLVVRDGDDGPGSVAISAAEGTSSVDSSTDCESLLAPMIQTWANDLASGGGSAISDIQFKLGSLDPRFAIVRELGVKYAHEASLHGDAAASATIRADLAAACADLSQASTTTTTISTPLTVAPPTVAQEQTSFKSDEEAAIVVFDAWQGGDPDVVGSIANAVVVDVLGRPDDTARFTGCGVQDPPIGSGTPADPVITSFCIISSDVGPAIVLAVGPSANGTPRVIDASEGDFALGEDGQLEGGI